MAGTNQACIICQIVRNPNSTTRLLHTVVAFQDIKPAARRTRNTDVIPKEHIPTVRDLQRSDEDYSLVSHMLSVGQELLQKDAPQTIHRWKAIKYKSLGPFGGFIEAGEVKASSFKDGKPSSTSLWDLLVVLLKQEKLRPLRSKCIRLSSSDSSLTDPDVLLQQPS